VTDSNNHSSCSRNVGNQQECGRENGASRGGWQESPEVAKGSSSLRAPGGWKLTWTPTNWCGLVYGMWRDIHDSPIWPAAGVYVLAIAGTAFLLWALM